MISDRHGLYIYIYSIVYGIVLYHAILDIYDELEYTSQYCTILFGPIFRCTMPYYILRSEKVPRCHAWCLISYIEARQDPGQPFLGKLDIGS